MKTLLLILLAIPGVPTRSPIMQDSAYMARNKAQQSYGNAQQAMMDCIVTLDSIRVITDRTNDTRTLAFAIDILNSAQAAMDFHVPTYAIHMEIGGAKLASVIYLESQSDKDRAYHEAAQQFHLARTAMDSAKTIVDLRLAQLRFILNDLQNPGL